MASNPDANPDSDPSGPSDSPEQVTPPNNPGRENVEDSPDDFAGKADTSNENRGPDQRFAR